MDYTTTYIVLAAAFGLFMAWGIGANDVANAMATSVGSKAITIKQAIFIAAIFEFAGAYLAGGEVTATIRKGIIDTSGLVTPEFLIFGMLAALLAAGLWLLLASLKGWPVSTTHSIVGAIIGFAVVGIGMEAVKWDKVGTIAASWVISPLLAGTIAFLLFQSVRKLVLDHDHPVRQARKYVPMYMFLAGFVIALVTLFKGLKHIGLEVSTEEAYIYATLAGLVVYFIGVVAIRRIPYDEKADREYHSKQVERVFAILMLVTACAMAFAHGSNDVANAVGPMAAVLSVVSSGEVAQKSVLPAWVLLVGGGGIVLGLIMLGSRVIKTVGKSITELTPSRGFAAELAAATTVVLASGTGIPISTTHTLVGAVLGIGLAHGIGSVNLGTVRTIFISWIVTLPAGAALAIVFFYLFKAIFYTG